MITTNKANKQTNKQASINRLDTKLFVGHFSIVATRLALKRERPV
jgi:hypothetical protein